MRAPPVALKKPKNMVCCGKGRTCAAHTGREKEKTVSVSFGRHANGAQRSAPGLS